MKHCITDTFEPHRLLYNWQILNKISSLSILILARHQNQYLFKETEELFKYNGTTIARTNRIAQH